MPLNYFALQSYNCVAQYIQKRVEQESADKSILLQKKIASTSSDYLPVIVVPSFTASMFKADICIPAHEDFKLILKRIYQTITGNNARLVTNVNDLEQVYKNQKIIVVWNKANFSSAKQLEKFLLFCYRHYHKIPILNVLDFPFENLISFSLLCKIQTIHVDDQHAHNSPLEIFDELFLQCKLKEQILYFNASSMDYIQKEFKIRTVTHDTILQWYKCAISQQYSFNLSAIQKHVTFFPFGLHLFSKLYFIFSKNKSSTLLMHMDDKEEISFKQLFYCKLVKLKHFESILEWKQLRDKLTHHCSQSQYPLKLLLFIYTCMIEFAKHFSKNEYYSMIHQFVTHVIKPTTQDLTIHSIFSDHISLFDQHLLCNRCHSKIEEKMGMKCMICNQQFHLQCSSLVESQRNICDVCIMKYSFDKTMKPIQFFTEEEEDDDDLFFDSSHQPQHPIAHHMCYKGSLFVEHNFSISKQETMQQFSLEESTNQLRHEEESWNHQKELATKLIVFLQRIFMECFSEMFENRIFMNCDVKTSLCSTSHYEKCITTTTTTTQKNPIQLLMYDAMMQRLSNHSFEQSIKEYVRKKPKDKKK